MERIIRTNGIALTRIAVSCSKKADKWINHVLTLENIGVGYEIETDAEVSTHSSSELVQFMESFGLRSLGSDAVPKVTQFRNLRALGTGCLWNDRKTVV